jgi:hypothetical protein
MHLFIATYTLKKIRGGPRCLFLLFLATLLSLSCTRDEENLTPLLFTSGSFARLTVGETRLYQIDSAVFNRIATDTLKAGRIYERLRTDTIIERLPTYTSYRVRADRGTDTSNLAFAGYFTWIVRQNGDLIEERNGIQKLLLRKPLAVGNSFNTNAYSTSSEALQLKATAITIEGSDTLLTLMAEPDSNCVSGYNQQNQFSARQGLTYSYIRDVRFVQDPLNPCQGAILYQTRKTYTIKLLRYVP